MEALCWGSRRSGAAAGAGSHPLGGKSHRSRQPQCEVAAVPAMAPGISTSQPRPRMPTGPMLPAAAIPLIFPYGHRPLRELNFREPHTRHHRLQPPAALAQALLTLCPSRARSSHPPCLGISCHGRRRPPSPHLPRPPPCQAPRPQPPSPLPLLQLLPAVRPSPLLGWPGRGAVLLRHGTGSPQAACGSCPDPTPSPKRQLQLTRPGGDGEAE